MFTRGYFCSLQMLASFFLLFTAFRTSTPIKQQTLALLDFKNQLYDPLNYLDSWKDTDSPCQFYGVTCDPKTGLVTEVSLDNKSLSGVISPSISGLKSLTSLWLPSNLLTGGLPDGLVNCTSLNVLNVSGNFLNGTIPDLSNLVGLEVLDLSINYFFGEFPSWFGNLSGLVSLGLGDNMFTQGEIPNVFGKLKKLTWLYLAGSNFIGGIPHSHSIFELEALGTLDLCRNQISGEFPKSIKKLRNLWKIEIYKNNLTGKIPSELAELSQLQELDVSSNQMDGKLPNALGNLKNLTVFHLFKNNFSGELPAGFADMQYLSDFAIYENSFSGPFPDNFGRFSPLNIVDISENSFSGTFPKYLCKKQNLLFLLALGNSFFGELPDSYADCNTLQRLRINRNNLSGKIPDGIWGLPRIKVIDFSDNNFIGEIHSRIGLATSLSQLVLTNNKFSGELPQELGKLIVLERLYLNNNNFSGPVPSELSALKQISFLDLENNSFSGEIPSELSQCPWLVDLNLGSNLLNGSIPDTFSYMLSLNSLNLSSNRLTGAIPSNLGRLQFSYIDVSNNQLSGVIPFDLLMMGGDNAFVENQGLCIDESIRNSINSTLKVCNRKAIHPKTMRNRIVIFCFMLPGPVVVFAGLLCACYWRQKKDTFNMEKQMAERRRMDPTWKVESFHLIEFNADEICNLDEDNLIGSGGTGKVYRLDLKKGCGPVAVKQLWKGIEMKVLETEMEILRKIRHRNIVKLYASMIRGCSTFLVFEYMENGNLFQALHTNVKVGKPELDWFKRYKIALGAAQGLSYLHNDCTPKIIHRDIKSTNILLDEDYEAKIADFGVAKAVQVPQGNELSCFTGTHGYLAPELAYSLKATEKTDIYSFGVVLLELVTGRKAIDDAYGEGKDLVYWASTHLNNRENVLKVLDPNALTKQVQDHMIKVLRIATLCTSKLPSLRPNMKVVVKMLVDAQPSSFMSLENCDKFAKASV